MSATEVDLRRVLTTLRLHAGRVIVLAAIGGLLAAFIGFLDRAPRYRSSAEIALSDYDSKVLALSVRAIRSIAMSEEVLTVFHELHPDLKTADLRARLSRQAADDDQQTLLLRLEVDAEDPEVALSRVGDWQRLTLGELSREALDNGGRAVINNQALFEAAKAAYDILEDQRLVARAGVEAEIRAVEEDWGHRLIAAEAEEAQSLARWTTETRRLFESLAAEAPRSWGPGRPGLLSTWTRLVEVRLRFALGGDALGDELVALEADLRQRVLEASLSMAPAIALEELQERREIELRTLQGEQALAERQRLAERTVDLRTVRSRLERTIEDLDRDTAAQLEKMLEEASGLRRSENWVERVGGGRAFVLRGPWPPQRPEPSLFGLRVLLGILLGLSLAILWPLVGDFMGRRRGTPESA